MTHERYEKKERKTNIDNVNDNKKEVRGELDEKSYKVSTTRLIIII